MRAVRWLPALLLAVVVLLPYHRLVTGNAIPIPDDVGASDLADGEFPIRVEAGRIARSGELPVWTPRVMTGMPIVVDPLSLGLFAVLPPSLALGILIGFLLLTSATGTYALARHLGASQSGAFLSGFAFAWSGFFICQMRHLGIIETVAFFPWALYCLERASAGHAEDAATARRLSLRSRMIWLAAFGCVFGLQLLATFPQSAYISALVYIALVAARSDWLLGPSKHMPWRERLRPSVALAFGAGAAMTVGTLIGMAVLLPLRELGSISDRHAGGTYEWATLFKYQLSNVLTFFFPYINGDISDLTYNSTTGLFWEDYGYVGLATVLAAIAVAVDLAGSVIRERSHLSPNTNPRSRTAFAIVFWCATGLTAYLLVLGPATPLYRLAYEWLPGLNLFRFPTRFLFVTELALALLGGLGITRLQTVLERRLTGTSWTFLPALAGALLASITVVDLVWHNRRQNPLVESTRWLSPPPTASAILKSGQDGRIFAPAANQHHERAFLRARGWSGDLTPYYLQRDFLQPNANLLHGLSTLNAYTGISPFWVVDLIGDHNRTGLIGETYDLEPEGITIRRTCYDWLEALSVRWLLSSEPVDTNRTERVLRAPIADLYRLKAPLPRVRFARNVRLIPDVKDIKRLSLAGELDPREVAIVHTPSDLALVESVQSGPLNGSYEARLTVDQAARTVAEVHSERGGLLVLADTFYPGWHATIDGAESQIIRVNVMHRGVAVPPGDHRITFEYRSPVVRLGLKLTFAGLLALTVTLIVLLVGRDAHAGTRTP